MLFAAGEGGRRGTRGVSTGGWPKGVAGGLRPLAAGRMGEPGLRDPFGPRPAAPPPLRAGARR